MLVQVHSMKVCVFCFRASRFSGIVTRALGLAVVLAFPGVAAQDPQSAPQTAPPAPANPDAAAKAAERRKHFEEEKRRLEESAVPQPKGVGAEVPPTDPNQTLFVSPAVVNMLVGETHSFSAFELNGKTITSSVEWSIDDPGIAELRSGGDPIVVSKAPGKVILRARLDTRTAEAFINIHDVQTLPVGTILWASPQIPGFKTKQIVQAVPSSTGPDMYTIEENEKGESLVRAMFGDGRQMWMRKMTGAISNAVPH
jgi:hypothetical protein